MNRNFDSHHGGMKEVGKNIWFIKLFDENLRISEAGASKDPCSEYFAGTPFSESETLALSEFVKSLDVKLYISFHSYGQSLMFPPVSAAYLQHLNRINICYASEHFSFYIFRVIWKPMSEIMMIW